MSLHYKQNSNKILSDDEILEIVTNNNLTKAHLRIILKNDKKVSQFGDGLLEQLAGIDGFVIGKIKDTQYQKDEFSYDQVEMIRFDNGSSSWYYTKQELPKKNQIVAVQLNKNWFNFYLLLKECDIKDSVSSSNKKDYSKSTYLTTKEISAISGVSSKEINSALVSLGLMKKNGDDWCTTGKGESYGGIQKDGQYGKFIVWPQEVITELEL